MATGANTTPLGPLHPVLAARTAVRSEPLLPTHPGLMGGLGGGVTSVAVGGGGSKDPELKRHLEAAKRAASALFPGVCVCVCVCMCIVTVLCTVYVGTVLCVLGRGGREREICVRGVSTNPDV